MNILYVDNDTGGLSCLVTANPGTTAGQFFAQRKPGKNWDEYTVRVDNADATHGQVLQNNQRVTVAPRTFAGA